MGIPQSCLDALVPHEQLHGTQGNTGHYQPTRKGVAQVVPAEVRKLSLLRCILEPTPPITLAWPLLTRANVPDTVPSLAQSKQGGVRGGVNLNPPGFAVLAYGNGDDSSL